MTDHEYLETLGFLLSSLENSTLQVYVCHKCMSATRSWTCTHTMAFREWLSGDELQGFLRKAMGV